MAERFSDIEKPVIHQPSLEERLKEYPELKAKIDSMLALISNAGGDVAKAAESERRIIEELRQTGNEVFTVGPPSAVEDGSGIQRQAGGESQGKKSSAGTPDWEKSK
jgi:hypothetical protein